ncbi:hypothetical protein [Falsiroseomonas sp. CW058]|uniref:hypothetical protein n=1 Tax=Falsiroseomonas sp. CW058 TaxID=3388664 RepID=UPI003D310FD3
MTQPSDQTPDNTQTLTLMVGVGAAVLAFFMPAVVFKGAGNAVHDLSIIEKLPVMTGIAFLALAAAVATRFMEQYRRWAEHATVAAIVLIMLPALWGFISAIDAWSGTRAMILQIAGTRSVIINPGAAYVPLIASAVLLTISLRRRKDTAQPAAA